MKASVTKSVLEIISKILGRNLDLKVVNLPRKEIDGWDSLIHMEIIFACEDLFQIEFTSEEMSSLNSAETIADCICVKLQ